LLDLIKRALDVTQINLSAALLDLVNSAFEVAQIDRSNALLDLINDPLNLAQFLDDAVQQVYKSLIVIHGSLLSSKFVDDPA